MTDDAEYLRDHTDRLGERLPHNPNVPAYPTWPLPQRLRYIAQSLDLLSRIVTAALPYIEVNGERLTDDDREALREWTVGTEQQDELRRLADRFERDAVRGRAMP